jgi:hypothetical protein
MQIKFKCTDAEALREWHRWYAWRPVFVGYSLVWREYVERRGGLDSCYDPAWVWQYRHEESKS